jgi:hypothetical protein
LKQENTSQRQAECQFNNTPPLDAGDSHQENSPKLDNSPAPSLAKREIFYSVRKPMPLAARQEPLQKRLAGESVALEKQGRCPAVPQFSSLYKKLLNTKHAFKDHV